MKGDNMEQFQEWIIYGLALLGGIAVLVNGLKGIEWMLTPFTSTKTRLGEHEEMLKRDKQRLDDMEDEQTELHEQVTVIGLALAELINHIVTGNDTEKLKEQQENLLKTFIR